METQKIRDSIIDGSFDLDETTRDGLQFVLEAACKEITPYIRCKQDIKNRNNEITMAKGKGLKKLALLVLCVFLGVVIFTSRLSNELTGLFVAIFIVLMSLFYHVSRRNKSSKIKKLKKELWDLERKEEDIIGNFLLLLIIPYKYRDGHAISKMLEYVQNKEASTWEGCIDLYKAEVSRSKKLMLAQEAAEESAVQREIAEKQLRAQHATAIASIISAPGILRIKN